MMELYKEERAKKLSKQSMPTKIMPPSSKKFEEEKDDNMNA